MRPLSNVSPPPLRPGGTGGSSSGSAQLSCNTLRYRVAGVCISFSRSTPQSSLGYHAFMIVTQASITGRALFSSDSYSYSSDRQTETDRITDHKDRATCFCTGQTQPYNASC